MAKNSAATDEGKSGGKGRLMLLLALLVVAVAAGATWFFILKPAPPSEPVEGEIVTVEPVQLNLAAGHYLRVGLALQLVEGAEIEPSKALDATITTFSGLPLSDVSLPDQREQLRDKLYITLDDVYDGDVLAVYFTEFVTQ